MCDRDGTRLAWKDDGKALNCLSGRAQPRAQDRAMHGRLVVGMVRRMRADLRIDQAAEQ
jgi:hypothetical protein